MRPSRASLVLAVALLAAATFAHSSQAASPTQLALGHQRLELPGVPVQTIAVDLDRDGARDLAVVVASTSWGEVGFEEPMQAGEDGTFVDVLTVVPTVLDRRELLIYLGAATGGGFGGEPLRFELPPGVHAIAAGPPAAPLVAWTADGVAEVVLGATPTESASTEGEPIASEPLEGEPAALLSRGLSLVPRIVARSILAGTTSFLARSGLIDDLDGDGDPDLFVPVAGGLEVHLSTPEGVTAAVASIVAPPEPDPADSTDPADAEVLADRRRRGAVREVLLPEAVDLNGDARPDLLYRDSANGPTRFRVRLNLGEGRFGPAFDPVPGLSAERSEAGSDSEAGREVAWLGDLDGDGRAEVVTTEGIPPAKESMRAELADAKRPHTRVRVQALGPDGRWTPAVKAEFVIEGYVFEGGDGEDGSAGSGGSDSDEDGDGGGIGIAFPSGVRDLDGDGKLELVALTLDFSLFEAMRILTTKTIQLGLDFGIYRQGEGLTFRPVPGLDLAGKLRFRLDSVSLGQLSSFAGDFDGDGRADFVQLGRGRKVTIHRGQAGARYAPEPDLAIVLEREPLDVALVAVSDLDGDGRSDLCVTQPVGGKTIGARAALDLYLSGASR
jgi:hypothetical protein